MDVKEEAPSSPEPSEESQNNIKVLPQKVKLIEMSLETIFIFFFSLLENQQLSQSLVGTDRCQRRLHFRVV